MHVGFVCSTYPPLVGGVETYNRQVAESLVNCGQKVTVATRFSDVRPEGGMWGLVASQSSGDSSRNGDLCVEVIKVPAALQILLKPVYPLHFRRLTFPVALGLYTAALRSSLASALRGVDLIHFSGTGREMLGFVAADLAKKWRVPFVVTSHQHHGSWGDSEIDYRLYNRAERYLAITDHERQNVVTAGYPDNRVRVVGHGVSVRGDGEPARMRAGLAIDGPVVLFLGRKTEYKGFGRLLEAAPLVWDAVPSVHFVLAGPDDDGAVDRTRSQYASVLGDPRMHELGFVTDRDREDLYALCDVFCLPSTAEAFGLAYIDAWFYGKPVVACAIPTLQELISDDAGILTDETGASVADAIIRLITDPSLRTRLGETGRLKASERTWDRVAQSLIGIYEDARES